ncbi:LysR family transcriptional regulator [Geobacter sp. SVR]|uniref:LysR family transcriptional regulator n=1 Tax=Geobacter sp. SVR TaxID=2495594 RepID=UPI00143EFBF4|nr:LysR family transcriptional regulator [Geobacter sp. SVR]BCS53204.1 LysR family transcriptional regulator [Geobacter sp. SVR]GCF84589.1 LysR family transcriptional regulator [Geobacter sp. SVR]
MDLRQLRFFLEVADSGSFTGAAEKLHIAQPALSIAIKKLEEDLDVVLFNRRDRKITLTAEGEVLARHAREIRQGVAKARQEIDDLRGLFKGEVRVGLTPMLSSFFFPGIISAFKRRYPALHLSVHGDSAWNIQRRIESGEIDMGVVAGAVPEGLDSHHMVREEVVACVHRSHAWAGRKKMPLAELLGEPLIQFEEGYHLREMIDELAAREGLSPVTVAESNLFSLVRSLVREELGLAFFLKMVVARDAEVAAISCDPPLFLDLSIAWKKNTTLSRANRAFVDFLIQEVDEYYLLAQAAGTFPLP